MSKFKKFADEVRRKGKQMLTNEESQYRDILEETKNGDEEREIKETIESDENEENIPISDIDFDVALDLFNTKRRRLIFEVLKGGESLSYIELAEYIASKEYDKEPNLITDTERKRVYVSIYQTHIDKMANDGVLTINENENGVNIKLSSEGEKLAEILEEIEGYF